MTDWVELTITDDTRKIWVNLRHIISITREKDCTILETIRHQDRICVVEEPEQIFVAAENT